MTTFTKRKSLKQELGPIQLQTGTGNIPKWLQGTLIRNGPSQFNTPTDAVSHWFDGLAMLHAFAFDAGQVVYSNRFLRTDAYQKMVHENRLDFDGFASDPCRSIFKRLFTAFFPQAPKLPNADVNVAKFYDAYVALTEVPLPVRFDPDSLATLGALEYTDSLPKDNIWNSAHPHLDARNNEYINYYVDFGLRSHYVIYRQPQHGLERQILCNIPVEKPSYMHSFALTEHYVILAEYPFVINPWAPLLSGKGFIKNYRWEPERGTRLTVVSRETGQIVCRPLTEPFFAFHHINAFELDQKLILDIIAYADANIVTALAPYGEGMVDPMFPLSQLRRIEIDLSISSATQQLLLNKPFELPRINERFNGVPYRYAYAADLREALNQEFRCLYKIDVESRTFHSWSEQGCCPGEPVFVASPGAQKEDQGVVLAVVIDQAHLNSFLLVLDAATFKEQARIQVPHLIPMGLHGQFFKDARENRL